MDVHQRLKEKTKVRHSYHCWIVEKNTSRLISDPETLKRLHCVYIRFDRIWELPRNQLIYMVARGGIEPPTRGFSIHTQLL